ncbi:NAD(P)-dependent oxidoreductase [Vannielia litorea]|uniref:Glutamate synthase (NADPH/NADH) small chain n=1 Tax=Vannielia litorea TaxID=1217970 RepID=A0A1N6G5E0_9RHOB|nr:NAD(P)-dependent oxidoreductase [Vannielia litorea]SIO02730.1 glutamate synthase (NADPH/NADH) small chain [Vannielia litorea]
MTEKRFAAGVQPGRLSSEEIARNFTDMHPPLGAHEAAVAADRCYFCHDAPCITACPTSIDIPLFIRQIQGGKPGDAGKTIFDQNILGGMCARVCPTETLCEEACVRNAAESEPVEIGRLQRYATDTVMARNTHPFTRAEATGKRVAVVGAGPAGLACAHRLAMHGHDVTLYDARKKPGGLNEYGIAAYKTVDGFAAREVDWLLGIGGIRLETGVKLGEAFTIRELQEDFDAVFIGIGLGGVNRSGLPGEALENAEDAVDFISRLRQADEPEALPVGRRVVVVGGGMTAVDAAVQAKLLGAESVAMVYRRGREAMGASPYEQEHAAKAGVTIVANATPAALGGDSKVKSITFERTETGADGRLVSTGEEMVLEADQVLLAIGQRLDIASPRIEIENGKIKVTGPGRTNLDRVWAGGDCTPGEDLTVVAVAEGRDAAEDMHKMLMEG